MSVTPEEITRLALLARLPLAPGGADALRADLDAILAHVRTLGALAHRSTQPFAGTGPGYARLRDDGGLPDTMLLTADALAPEWEDGFFIVPRLSSHADTPISMPPPSAVGAAVEWEPYVDDGLRAVPDDVERKPGAASAGASGARPADEASIDPSGVAFIRPPMRRVDVHERADDNRSADGGEGRG
jgi:aspartyl-tRNA(Asn)/glutamyl-tRNA(Gln) amidotransferase subunit C